MKGGPHMQSLKVADLKPHPKNSYFFDDMVAEPWDSFLESIRTSGVIEPVIVTQDMVIVSGHQRVRACKELGIKEVLCDVRRFDSEEEILKQLIETNIRQRGIGNTNAVKLGRCIAELEQIYGIKNGGDRKSESHNVNLISQSDLAEQLNMSKMQLNRYKSLTDLIPELQDAVQSGQITATTAMGFVKKLSPEEQRQLAEQIAGKSKVSGAEVQQYIDQIKAKDEEIERLRKAKSQRESELIMEKQELERKLSEKAEVKEIMKEVEPPDYQELKIKAENYDSLENQYNAMLADRNRINVENGEMRKKLEAPEHDLKENCFYFCAAVDQFLKRYGGIRFLKDDLKLIGEADQRRYIGALNKVREFAESLLDEVTED